MTHCHGNVMGTANAWVTHRRRYGQRSGPTDVVERRDDVYQRACVIHGRGAGQRARWAGRGGRHGRVESAPGHTAAPLGTAGPSRTR